MDNEAEASLVDSAVAEGGAYEIIRKRLESQGEKLETLSRELNASRLEEFGSTSLDVISRIRVRTENNTVARDIVKVGPYLLFGYNVFIGLRKETKVKDVFSLFQLVGEKEDAIEELSQEGTFLTESRFVNDFTELYRYYKNSKLLQLMVKNGKLLAAFQIGERIEDVRVFRWEISADATSITYLDNRGERDIQLPSKYDFEWTEITRDNTEYGRHPHANILDEIFVETLGGTLTVKIENNTENGFGIYNEDVEDKTQSLDDAKIFHASLGSLILIKILPYRETQWRYLVFNRIDESVTRIDEIGQSCVQLPENHGIIFPGGYYLQTGEFKHFDDVHAELSYKRTIRSPNGEDVLYVFYAIEDGIVALLTYNLIKKSLQNPIYGHGYAIGDDGKLVVFTAENEATRVHPMQIWSTPYISDEFAAKIPPSQSFFGKIGNADLVRGISDLFSVSRSTSVKSVTLGLYEELVKTAQRLFDDYYWLRSDDVTDIAATLSEIIATSELVIDEFIKVKEIQKKSVTALSDSEKYLEDILKSVQPENWESAQEYVNALQSLRKQRGHLATIKSYRYMNTDRISELDALCIENENTLAEKTVQFLSGPHAISPYLDKVDEFNRDIQDAKTRISLEPLLEAIQHTVSSLDVLSELMSTLKVDDATLRTQIIDAISEVYGKLNQCKAKTNNKYKELGSQEAVAQFSAQFKLFSQSITNALGLATTPEKCDDQLSRLLAQLEEFESQFSEYDQFLDDILGKRDEVYEAFEQQKQQLLDTQQRKVLTLTDAAERLLKSIERRSQKLNTQDELHTYYASDALVGKVRDLVDQLKSLSGSVQADDVEAKLKSIQDNALRALRDKTDIYESGGNVIKLGPKHRFSVNTQELDLTILPKDDALYFHLSGTDYFKPVRSTELSELSAYWKMSLESESDTVYRAEYLAAKILEEAKVKQGGLSLDQLNAASLDFDLMMAIVRDFSAPLYKEGYEKGIHDHDAALILSALVPVYTHADLLIYDPLSRGLAQVFWANVKYLDRIRQAEKISQLHEVISHETWHDRAQSAAQLESVFASAKAIELLVLEVNKAINQFLVIHPIPVSELDARRAAEYLVAEFGRDTVEFVSSKYAQELVDTLKSEMDDLAWKRYELSLEKMLGWPAQRWALSVAWLEALVEDKDIVSLKRYIPEAVALINSHERISRRATQLDLKINVEGFLGSHLKMHKQALSGDLDDFLMRLDTHTRKVVPEYKQYLALRQKISSDEKEKLRLDQFKASPLSSFVRNRLVNESYLPLIGDNLAKQIGTVGENKRSDLMGLLMMISPPGYGKTTLMEYVADRLGLIFMKVNCPSLGHEVMSLDPEQAPNATAKQELLKINLSFEMGNNVMLYLDDIQHTHPEFLQKFISLCDGTRRIDGVWDGQTKTYDMRGKKFCVIMAGNPYTEAGEAFKVPDMLANRADIYNLGDILGGMDEQFALSYIENCLTSNPVLAPLATKEMSDTYKLIDLAKGKEISSSEFSHSYSGAELNEMVGVLQKLFRIQDVILKINQQYIASAAQDDKFRVEPAFKLQGSYRNMNKMAEKISGVMNDAELEQLIQDHYLGEAQMLTTGAEANLLKLKSLLGILTDAEEQRWQEILRDFLRNKAMGGDADDVGANIVSQLVDLVGSVNHLGVSIGEQNSKEISRELERENSDKKHQELGEISNSLKRLERYYRNYLSDEAKIKPLDSVPQITNVEVVNQPVPGIDKILRVLAKTIEESIFPIVRSMDKKLEIDLRTHETMQRVLEDIRDLEKSIGKGSKVKKSIQGSKSTP